jgi:hypothetical protein
MAWTAELKVRPYIAVLVEHVEDVAPHSDMR